MSEGAKIESTLFDKVYEGAKDAVKTMKKPLVERAMKRRFQAAYDDASRIIDESELELVEEREKLADCDVNSLLSLRKKINGAKELQSQLKEEYQEMFDEKLS